MQQELMRLDDSSYVNRNRWEQKQIDKMTHTRRREQKRHDMKMQLGETRLVRVLKLLDKTMQRELHGA